MKKDDIREKHSADPPIDAMDRKILGALVDDATQSYAELGRRVGLSAPAVHERVKRLRAAHVITSTSVRVDGKRIGKPLLVFIHVQTQNWGYSAALADLADRPEVEEVHTVTGDTSVILKVRVPGSDALESFLRQLHTFESVVATETFVTLSTYVDRPVQATQTEDWVKPPLPTS